MLMNGVSLNEEERDSEGNMVMSQMGGEPFPGELNRMRRDDLARL